MNKAIVAATLWLCRTEEGATMVEYGLMLALIAAVCIAAVTAIGNAASGMFTQVAGYF